MNAFLTAWAQQVPETVPREGTRWCPGCDMMGWGHMGGWGALMMILFWVVVIGAVALLVRALLTGRGGQPEGGSAIDILKKRYARGEISREEFERLKGEILA